LETNSCKHNWEDFNLSDIIGGVTVDGVRYLKLFLIDYASIFSEVVNPSCSKCLNNYLHKYKTKFKKMESNSQYKLKNKYNGISLEFGSAIQVFNDTITDELAKKLLKSYDKELIFEKYPLTENTKEEVSEINMQDAEIASTKKAFKKRR
jgi:hypothetical protein